MSAQPDSRPVAESGPLGDPADTDSSDTKARLREVALELFGRQGVQATSTREIIKAAGLRNPSAITYYFGSKANLVEDLTGEVDRPRTALLQQHVVQAGQSEPLTPQEWATIGVEFVIDLLSTRRGCYLARVWGDHDDDDPDRVERFLSSSHPLASAWRAAVIRTFPDLPPAVAIARNIIVIRTLQWMSIRRALSLIAQAADHERESPRSWHTVLADLRPLFLELSLNVLTGPTRLTDQYFLPEDQV